VICLAAWLFWTGGAAQAKGLGQATVTQVNNDVRYQPAGAAERRAKTQDVVRGADVVRTGAKSQTELEFEDRTITRIGSNSIFTFDPEKRRFELKNGVMVFDMPKGAGGGRIVTPAGTAAIEGTSGIVSYRSPLKVICLTGVIKLLDAKGNLLTMLKPGQMFIAGITPRPVEVKLKGMTGKLLQGGLPNNQQEFNDTVNDQMQQLASGALQETPFMMIGEGTDLLVLTTATPQQEFMTSVEELAEQLAQIDGSQAEPSGELPPPGPPTTPIVVDSGDTIDKGQPRVFTTATDATKLDGTTDADQVAVFDAGNRELQFTGQPLPVAPEGQPFKAEFRGAGITLNSFGLDLEGDELDGAVLKFTSSRNLIVGLSFLNTSGPNEGGLIQLLGNGITSFQGRADDPCMAISQGLQGGRVEIASDSSTFGDLLFVRDALIDVSSTADPEQEQAGQGGSVWLRGKRQVEIQETTDIMADGPQAGTIDIQSAGTDAVGGLVRLNPIGGHIRLSAQEDPIALSELSAGDPASVIEILGAQTEDGKTIQIGSSGPAGGGDVELRAADIIATYDAAFMVGHATLPAGTVQMESDAVTLDRTLIMANSQGAQGGQVFLTGNQIVQINPDTDIQANGVTAGAIRVQSAGLPSQPGEVNVVAQGEGFVRLSAQDTVAALGALAGGGTIEIVGVQGATDKTVKIAATGPAGGGNIAVQATQSLLIRHAHLSADAPLGSSLPAGSINIAGRDITINNSLLSATSAAGAGGTIRVTGAAAGVVNINNTTMRTTGVGGAADAITIRGGTVNFTGTSVDAGAGRFIHVYRNDGSGSPAVTSGTLEWHAYAP
jgi:hypothetical protein